MPKHPHVQPSEPKTQPLEFTGLGLIGQVMPARPDVGGAGPGRVVVEADGGGIIMTVPFAAVGRFEIDPVPAERFRLQFTVAHVPHAVTTEWLCATPT